MKYLVLLYLCFNFMPHPFGQASDCDSLQVHCQTTPDSILTQNYINTVDYLLIKLFDDGYDTWRKKIITYTIIEEKSTCLIYRKYKLKIYCSYTHGSPENIEIYMVNFLCCCGPYSPPILLSNVAAELTFYECLAKNLPAKDLRRLYRHPSKLKADFPAGNLDHIYLFRSVAKQKRPFVFDPVYAWEVYGKSYLSEKFKNIFKNE